MGRNVHERRKPALAESARRFATLGLLCLVGSHFASSSEALAQQGSALVVLHSSTVILRDAGAGPWQVELRREGEPVALASGQARGGEEEAVRLGPVIGAGDGRWVVLPGDEIAIRATGIDERLVVPRLFADADEEARRVAGVSRRGWGFGAELWRGRGRDRGHCPARGHGRWALGPRDRRVRPAGFGLRRDRRARARGAPQGALLLADPDARRRQREGPRSFDARCPALRGRRGSPGRAAAAARRHGAVREPPRRGGAGRMVLRARGPRGCGGGGRPHRRIARATPERPDRTGRS